MNSNLAPIAGIHQAAGMRGFAAEFRDLDHYIRVITERIWEGRRIDDIRTYYSDPCIVETPAGVSTSVQQVIDGTRATLHMFPDRRLLAEDIIQSGDEEGGFLSSHRIISTMTHRGEGSFGLPTGRRVHARTVADCVCKDNRVIHEWLVRDQGAIARQIGIPPRDLAARWLETAGGWSKPVAGPAPGHYKSHISTDTLAQDYAHAVQAMVRGDGKVATAYDDAVHHIGPGETVRYGHDEVASFWTEVSGSLQVQAFHVEHLALNRGGGRADRVALRWRAMTRHQGDGWLGKASGKALEVMGINHAEIFRGRVLREWVLLDEIALWMQILGAQR